MSGPTRQCAPACADLQQSTGTRYLEPTSRYVEHHPVLRNAPTRSWITLVVTDVPNVRCGVCDLQLYAVEVDGYLDRLIVAYWDQGAERGGDLTVSYQPPPGVPFGHPPAR